MNILYSQKLKKFPIRHGFSTKSYSYSDQIIFPKQNHTNKVIIADYLAKREGDAIVTTKKNLRIGIKTADCVPVLLFERQKEIVAAVHAGWLGTAKQILKETIQRIVDMGGRAEHIFACLGPAIGPCCYHISGERLQHFDTKFLTERNGKTFLNLKKANITQLIDMQVPLENIESTPWCTSCNNDLFYSYRKEKPLTGQNISYIELN